MARMLAGRDSPRTLFDSKGPSSVKCSSRQRCCDRLRSEVDLQRLWAYCVGPVLCLSLLAGHVYLARRGSFSSAPSTLVAVLSNSSFDDFIANNPDGALVNFHSPDCTHCHKLVPELEAAAREFEGNYSFASVNTDVQPHLAARFGVHRYPTVLWFQNGENVQELPPRSRTADKISEFIAWVSQPALIEFATRGLLEEALPTLRETLKTNLPPVICGYAGVDGVRAALERAAQQFREKTVFLFIPEEQAEGPVIRSFSRFAADDKFYEGPVSPESILEWVKSLVADKDKASTGA